MLNQEVVESWNTFLITTSQVTQLETLIHLFQSQIRFRHPAWISGVPLFSYNTFRQCLGCILRFPEITCLQLSLNFSFTDISHNCFRYSYKFRFTMCFNNIPGKAFLTSGSPLSGNNFFRLNFKATKSLSTPMVWQNIINSWIYTNIRISFFRLIWIINSETWIPWNINGFDNCKPSSLLLFLHQLSVPK